MTWRDDLDNLLACCGEAQWVEEADERLTALLTERDAQLLRLDERTKERDHEAREFNALFAAQAELNTQHKKDLKELQSRLDVMSFNLELRDKETREQADRLDHLERTRKVAEDLAAERLSRLDATTRVSEALKTACGSYIAERDDALRRLDTAQTLQQQALDKWMERSKELDAIRDLISGDKPHEEHCETVAYHLADELQQKIADLQSNLDFFKSDHERSEEHGRDLELQIMRLKEQLAERGSRLNQILDVIRANAGESDWDGLCSPKQDAKTHDFCTECYGTSETGHKQPCWRSFAFSAPSAPSEGEKP